MKQCIAVYLRLSQEDVDKRTNTAKDESNSISAQRSIIERYIADKADLSVISRREFCDDGYTGTSFSRPAFTEMINLVKRGEISCVIVKDLSRFGRDYIEVGDYLEHIFPFLGIRIISVNDRYDSAQHRGRTGGVDIAFKNLINDYYSKDLSRKVKYGMGVRQKKAQYVNCVPYGYRRSPTQKHQMIIDEEAARIVRRIFDEVISGKSTVKIAQGLNGDGIPTPYQHKGIRDRSQVQRRWTHHAVISIIRNIKYTGTMVNHTRESRFIRDKACAKLPPSEWSVRENAHEAIVTQEQFDAANAALRHVSTYNRKEAAYDCDYICAHCGYHLRKTHGTETYLSCPSAQYHGNTGNPCAHIHVSKAKMDDVVLCSAKTLLSLSDEEPELEKTAQDTRVSLLGQINGLKSELDSIKRDRLRHYEAYRASELTAEQLMQANKRSEERRKEIIAQLDALEKQFEQAADEQEHKDEEQRKMEGLRGLSDEMIRERLPDYIEKVLVFSNDRIEIVWKYSA